MSTRIFLVTFALCFTAAGVFGQFADQSVPELEGVEIVEHLDENLPLELTFTDSTGETVRLGEYFNDDKPVILTLNYYRCPKLCGFVFNGIIEGLKNVQWTPGEEFTWVNISINPLETAELARINKEGYMADYQRPGASKGVHFHVGSEENIKKLADAVGYGYEFDERTKEYSHGAAIFLATPDGRLSRYLYGVKFASKDLRLGLIEASEGKIGSTIDKFVFWCHRYDPEAGSYTVFAWRIMQLGGFLTVGLLATGIGLLWFFDRGRTPKDAPGKNLGNNDSPQHSALSP